MDPVAYEEIMSNPVGVFRRKLEIRSRGSGDWPMPKAYLLIYKASKLHLCLQAAPSSPMSFWLFQLSWSSCFCLESHRTLRRERNSTECQNAHSSPHFPIFIYLLQLGVDGLDFMPTSLYFSWATSDMGLMSRSLLQNPAFLIQPEVCFLYGFKTWGACGSNWGSRI